MAIEECECNTSTSGCEEPVCPIEVLREELSKWVSRLHACIYKMVARFGIRSQPRSWITSMMRKLEIGVSRNMNLSGIVTMILGAMYVGAMAMAVFLILVQYTSREGMPCTFPPLFRVELGVLGLFWDFWAKSVSELQLEVEQIQLTFAPSTPNPTSVKFSNPLMMSYVNTHNPCPNIIKFPMMHGLSPHSHPALVA